jgi:biopolymer transport protein TolR
MAMSAGTAGGVKASPNVTPMIDVMLVLLIIFMLVIPAITAGFQAFQVSVVNLKPHPVVDLDHVVGLDAIGKYYLFKKSIRKA